MEKIKKKQYYFLIFYISIALFCTILCTFILTRNLNRRTFCYLDYKNELHFSSDCRHNSCLSSSDDEDLAKDYILLGGGNND